ncbi:MAG: hypothetical protein SFW63_04840 [Alphaproteobacteria bacterium]|nr:hypothetical protein [Alphaproteobacteria bacterium]
MMFLLQGDAGMFLHPGFGAGVVGAKGHPHKKCEEKKQPCHRGMVVDQVHGRAPA